MSLPARSLAFLGAALALAGCQAGYYAHLIRGQYDLLSHREPITDMLENPQLGAPLRAQLQRALDARRFASRTLLLPDNDSYKTYKDLGRPAAMWNVFATPELSLQAREWCYAFGLAGCYAYRGYYDEQRAHAEAERLRAEGYDVNVGGVPAYSTLGWFDDPLLNTALGAEDAVAGTIFHELAHQQLFVTGDTAFNESFATFVEHEGLQEYLRDAPELAKSATRRRERYVSFVRIMLAARKRLDAVYASATPAEERRAAKQREFARLREEYAALKAEWGGYAGYDRWFDDGLNNARLLPFGLYHQWVAAFDALFRRVDRQWPAFYAEVERLADLDPPERNTELAALKAESLAQQAQR
jgi:predicted aminopeptidase